MVETPVLFITFVRPDYARQTWEGIKAAQPKTLYFYSNKGRAEKEGEVERNNEIRAYINEIDWECDLHTFFRDECVNVYDSLRGAIDWLFDNEEQGIILEEDCVPTKAFFSFADQMIVKFKEDKRIGCISGDNFLKENPSGYDYSFSYLHTMFGWATWSDRWHSIQWGDLKIKETLDFHLYYKLFKNPNLAALKEKWLYDIREFLPDTECWDYCFGLTMDQKCQLTIVPRTHLVMNVGIKGEHHDEATLFNSSTDAISDDYVIERVPPFVFEDEVYDNLIYNKMLKDKGLIVRVINRLKKVLNNYGK